MDPIQEEPTILSRFLKLFKKVFKRPEPNSYFVSPSKITIEDFDNSVWSLQNAIAQFGKSCDDASKAMINLSKARKEM